MNAFHDDARITAYILDELEPAERKAFEAELKTNPDLRAEVEAMSSAAGFARKAFADAPREGLEDAQRDAVLEAARSRRRLPRLPRLPLTLAAAAAVLITAGLGVLYAVPALHAPLAGPLQLAETRGERAATSVPEPARAQPAPPPAAEPPADAASPQVEQPERQVVAEERASAAPPPPPAAASPPAGAPSQTRTESLGMPAHFYTELSADQGGSRDGRQYRSPGSQGGFGGTADDAFQHRPPQPDLVYPGGEGYDGLDDNPFRLVVEAPLSTFSIDVDTASYSNMRRFITHGQRPPRNSVRIEELINYFDYDYPAPRGGEVLGAHIEATTAPWNEAHRLVRIGLKGQEIEVGEQPAMNLVFLIDVSGSMRPENRLPLVQRALKMLVNRLRPQDRVAIVVYASQTGVHLPSRPGSEAEVIRDAIDQLRAGGSTNAGSGIQQAYRVAQEHFIPGGVNRVILCTDGDFNVGITDRDELTAMVEGKAKSGVYLTVLGFGMGNLKDGMLEHLSNKGNGMYAYIDTEAEARKVFVHELTGTLVTIAQDVKIQVEFNPGKVEAYRLIGYENRALAAEDFLDDTKDAGEIGAGHTVTALYEVVPRGLAVPGPQIEGLRYQRPAERPDEPSPPVEIVESDELLTLKVRYQPPGGGESIPREWHFVDDDRGWREASTDTRWAATVAAFGMILRESPHKGSADLDGVIQWARNAIGEDTHGYREAFVALAEQYRSRHGRR